MSEPKKFEDILDDFNVYQRALYASHISPHTIASLAEEQGDEFVYWDLYDFLFK